MTVEAKAVTLERVDLLELEALHSRIALCAEAVGHRSVRAKAIELESAIKVLELRNEQTVLEAKKQGTEKELADLVATLSEKYGVDLSSTSYDDKTGEIHTEIEEQQNHGD